MPRTPPCHCLCCHSIASDCSEARVLCQHGLAAQIHSIEGFSAHADQGELVAWVERIPETPRRIFLVHGEPEARSTLGELLRQSVGVSVFAPDLDDGVNLIADGVALIPTTSRIHRPGTTVAGPLGGMSITEPVADLWQTVSSLRQRLDELERAGATPEDMRVIVAALTEAQRWVERALPTRDRR